MSIKWDGKNIKDADKIKGQNEDVAVGYAKISRSLYGLRLLFWTSLLVFSQRLTQIDSGQHHSVIILILAGSIFIFLGVVLSKVSVLMNHGNFLYTPTRNGKRRVCSFSEIETLERTRIFGVRLWKVEYSNLTEQHKSVYFVPNSKKDTFKEFMLRYRNFKAENENPGN